MRIFVAGASGAIGQPLIAELIRQGHTVTAMSRSAAGAQKLVDLRASVAVVNAFDLTGRQSFLHEMLDRKEDLGNAIALNSSTFNAARLVGPSLELAEDKRQFGSSRAQRWFNA